MGSDLCKHEKETKNEANYNVKVKTQFGEEIDIEVNDNTTINDVHFKIENMNGIASSKISVMPDFDFVQDEPKKEDTVVFDITLETQFGGSTNVKVNDQTTVNDLHFLVENTNGIANSKSGFIRNDNNNNNNNDNTLSLNVQTQFGKNIKIDNLSSNATANDISDFLEMNEGIANSKSGDFDIGMDYVDIDPMNSNENVIITKPNILPKNKTLKELGIGANETISWTTAHDLEIGKYAMKQMDSIQVSTFDDYSDYENDGKSCDYKCMISIAKLIAKDDATLKRFEQCLVQRGWVLVEYPIEIRKMISEICGNVMNAMRNIKNDEWNQIGSNWGYRNYQNYKQVLRVLTGDLLGVYGKEYPMHLWNDIKRISSTMDELSLRIIDAFDAFGNAKLVGIGNGNGNMNVTVLNGYDRNGINNNGVKAGMIDFVNYSNDLANKNDSKWPMIRNENINVNLHTDPGLFSLSFMSTNHGLQLYDLSIKKWIDIPINCGVLWCGECAPKLTNNKVKSGIHRVVFNDNGQRFTAWYEACVDSQLNDDICTN